VILIFWGVFPWLIWFNSNHPMPLENLGPGSEADARKSQSGYDVGSCSMKKALNSGRLMPRVLKRELSPLQRARLSLGLDVDAQPRTNLARLLRRAGVAETAICRLGASSDEQAQQIVALYHRLNATERKAVTIDYLIMAAGANPAHIWGCINAELYREAVLLACINAPRIMQTVIEHAKTPDGYQDQKLVLQMAGLLPVPGQPGLLLGAGGKE
jgi:hypothetical protein